MKRLLSALLVLAFFASMLYVAPRAEAVTHGFTLGDANDDSEVSMKDVLFLRRYIAGLESDDDLFYTAADIVTDTEINMKDVLKLRRVIAGLDDAEGNNTDGRYKVDEIKIADKNISRYTIVYPESVPEDSGIYLQSTAYSAGELKTFISNACGSTLNIAYDNGKVSGPVIRYTFDYDNEMNLGKEGFSIKVDGDSLTITSGTMRGALYATYSILEDFVGYRFLTGNVTYLYESEKVDIPNGYSDLQVPSIAYRAIGASGPRSNCLRMKLNGSDGGATIASKGEESLNYGGAVGTTYLHAHSFVYYMAGFENRNDPSLDSVAGNTQPCMTDEATYDAIIDFMYKFMEWRKSLGQVPGYHFTQVSCSANDNGNYCPCDDCKAIYAAEGSVAGTLIRLCNRVAEKFLADYPEVELYTAAYGGSHIPPKMTRPDPRVCICFCSVGCNNHLLRNTDECTSAGGNRRLLTADHYTATDAEKTIPQNNELWMGFLSDWLELTDNVWYWYYTDNWAYYMSPAANIYNFYDDIKYLTELGVKGYYLEGDADDVGYTFEFLRQYLMTKIMWDPEMTEEEYVSLLDEYLMIYYGEGWEYIKEYLNMQNYAGDLKGCWTNNFDYPWDVYDKSYYCDNYETMKELFKKAYDAASTGELKSRVELCSMHMYFLGLSATYERDWVNGDSASRDTFASEYKWLWNYLKNRPGYFMLNSTFIGNEGATGLMWNFPSNGDTPCDPMNWLLPGGDFTGKR